MPFAYPHQKARNRFKVGTALRAVRLSSFGGLLRIALSLEGEVWRSIPDVFFVVFDAVFLEEPPVFVLKRHLLVVLALFADVFLQRGRCAGLMENMPYPDCQWKPPGMDVWWFIQLVEPVLIF